MIREFLRRLSYLFRRGSFDHGLDEEARFHIESRADELEATGLSRSAALAQARREFGSAARMSEDSRSAWQIGWLEDLASDLRYATRAFRRDPVFALTAIACLALGIGANTTIFSLTMEMLFSRPSARNPETIANLELGGSSNISLANYRFLRSARVFDDLAGENEELETNWRNGSATQRIAAFCVTDNFFDFAGIPVLLGRAPREGEPPAVVLSYGFWQRAFGGESNVIGRSMVLDGRVYGIAAVLPRDHRTLLGFGFQPDIYYPADEKTTVRLFARLGAGMSRGEAIGRLTVAARELDRIHPGDYPWINGVRVIPATGVARLTSENMLPIAAFFMMLMIVVGLVLLIACANVAGLLLARAGSRAQELAVRLSIGAGRGRLIRQLLAESLLLALAGVAAGLAMNIVLSSLVNNLRLPLPIPLQFSIRPDWRLLAYSVAIALCTAIVTGFVPALRATAAGLNAALKRELPASRRRWNLRNGLVVGQLAVSIVLLSAGFIFVRNLMLASTTRPGFDIDHSIWSYMRLVPESYTDPAKTHALAAAALDRLRSLPGVESASIARVVPLNDNMVNGIDVRVDSSPQTVHVNFKTNYVAPDYFRTMDIALLQGRDFNGGDTRTAPRVAIINENAARQLFGQGSAVGHTVTWLPGTAPVEIIGVVRNSKYFTLGETNPVAWYAPYEQMNGRSTNLHFLVRATGRPEPLVPVIGSVLGKFDSTAAIDTKPMSKALVFALLPSRFGAAILGSVGLLGLTLAAIGLYGALLFSVSRRIREIGLRMALGATPRSVLVLVVRQSAVLVGTGLALGTGLAVLSVRPLALFLMPEVRPADPLNFVIVAGVLGLVALTATLSPAIRALRIDPLAALRHE
jgi:predicted permease